MKASGKEMRFLKKLLLGVYIYLALFSAATLIIFVLCGIEPTTLITCVFGVAGIESMLGAVIKSAESKKKGKEDEADGTDTCEY